jgi:DNA end-binding protein Ku
MRAVWKGAISFGLVTIPVKLYRATEQRDVSFHQVRASDGSRIRYQRVAAADGQEVDYADLAKGYELPSGETVVLTDADLADLPLTSSRSIEVDSFVPLEQVDPIFFDKTYYVEPDGPQAGKPYALLRDALAQSGRVALVKVALRQREQLATLRVRDGLFVLETMIWPDEIRAAEFSFLEEKVEVRPQELSMAASLIESLSGDFHPEQYTDAYREALEAVVQAKIDGHQVKTPPDPDRPTADVVDLMSALRASVDAAKRERAANAGDAAAPTPPAATKAAKPAAGSTAKKAATGRGTARATSRPAKPKPKAEAESEAAAAASPKGKRAARKSA